jgi:hypothetical protein
VEPQLVGELPQASGQERDKYIATRTHRGVTFRLAIQGTPSRYECGPLAKAAAIFGAQGVYIAVITLPTDQNPCSSLVQYLFLFS